MTIYQIRPKEVVTKENNYGNSRDPVIIGLAKSGHYFTISVILINACKVIL